MELFQLPINLTTLLLFSTFLLFLIIKAITKHKSPPKLPPSPPKLPLIGHLHHLRGGLAHRQLRRLSQKYGPIMSLQLGEVPTVVISSREASKEVLRVQDPCCADRPDSIAIKLIFYDYTAVGFCEYGEYWRQMRKICILEMLSAKNVRSYGYIRRDEIDRLIRTVRSASNGGEAVNLTAMAYGFTFSVTCRAAFGKVTNGRDSLIDLFKQFEHMAGGFEIADVFPSLKLLHLFSWNKYKLMKIKRQFDAVLDVIVEEHRRKRRGEFDGEDLVDVLLRIQKDKELQFPLTTDNIKANIQNIFVGGTDTSATAIDCAMAELMRNPPVMAKLLSEIREAFKGKTTVEDKDVQGLKYLKLVIKETLRLHPPFPLLPRKCREECHVDSYTIPNKTRVIINVWSMGRDPEYWEDPETFRPERFENSSIDFVGNDFEFLPFGSGRRNCAGMNFGLANVELPLAQLLYHFDWKLPKGMNPDDVDMSEVDGIAVGRKTPLILIPTLYNPSN